MRGMQELRGAVIFVWPYVHILHPIFPVPGESKASCVLGSKYPANRRSLMLVVLA